MGSGTTLPGLSQDHATIWSPTPTITPQRPPSPTSPTLPSLRSALADCPLLWAGDSAPLLADLCQPTLCCFLPQFFCTSDPTLTSAPVKSKLAQLSTVPSSPPNTSPMLLLKIYLFERQSHSDKRAIWFTGSLPKWAAVNSNLSWATQMSGALSSGSPTCVSGRGPRAILQCLPRELD